MSPSRWPSLRLILLILFLLSAIAACAPAAVEPEAVQTNAPAAEAPSALAAYPGAPSAASVAPTPSPQPYPWPTQTAGPTEPPELTMPPDPTEPPMPTLPPTPVVTPIPTAEPPFIPFPDGTTPQPFSLYWREGDVIRTMRSDETEPRLFLDPAEEFGLYLPPPEAGIHAWGAASPDGQTMALVLAEEPQPVFIEEAPYPVHIYLLDQETRGLRLLAKNGLEPVWSPDGERLAYRSTETSGLWVAEVEKGVTAEIYQVDKANEHIATQYTWAWDSRRLVLIDEVPFQSMTLAVIDVDQLKASPIIMESPQFIGRPQWSPAGDVIAFTWSAGEGGKGPHIWKSNIDGTDEKQLTSHIRALSGLPLWSEDGNWIAFSGLAEYESVVSQYDLWLISAEGHDLKRMTFDSMTSETLYSVDQFMPIWSPDRTQLLFTQGTEVPGESQIWVLSLLDGSRRQLTSIISVYDIGLIAGS